MSGVKRLTVASITQGKSKGKALIQELGAMNSTTPKKKPAKKAKNK